MAVAGATAQRCRRRPVAEDGALRRGDGGDRLRRRSRLRGAGDRCDGSDCDSAAASRLPDGGRSVDAAQLLSRQPWRRARAPDGSPTRADGVPHRRSPRAAPPGCRSATATATPPLAPRSWVAASRACRASGRAGAPRTGSSGGRFFGVSGAARCRPSRHRRLARSQFAGRVAPRGRRRPLVTARSPLACARPRQARARARRHQAERDGRVCLPGHRHSLRAESGRRRAPEQRAAAPDEAARGGSHR